MRDILISRPGGGLLYVAHEPNRSTPYLIVPRIPGVLDVVKLGEFLDEEARHTVYLSDRDEPVDCSCPAFRFGRGWCRHQLLVWNHLQLESGNVGGTRKAI